MTKNFSNQPFISLKLIGFNEIDNANFKSILSIAEFRLDITWQVVDSVDADFYLLGSRLRTQMDQNALLHSLPRKQCIFCTQNTIDDNDNELITSSDNIPSLSSLVLLFNRLTKTETVVHTNDPISVELPSAVFNHNLAPAFEESLEINKTVPIDVETEYFDPEQGFVGLLLSNEKGIRCFNLNNAAGIDKLYIHAEERTYYSNNKLELLNGFFSTSTPLLPQSLSEAELQQKIAAEGLKSQPLSNLIWHCVFSCSQGKVIKGYNPSDIVHLKRWPDINLPGCRELIKLAAYMQSNAGDLKTAQIKTSIPIEQINNFYNACMVIGLVEQVQQTDLHEKSLTDEKRHLFEKIGLRLNQPNLGIQL